MTPFPQPPTSPQELPTLYDDFTQLQSLCAFFCDSVVALHIAEVDMDKRSVNGLHMFAGQVKRRAEALRQKLQVVCEVMD